MPGMIELIAEKIQHYENQNGHKPDYVMIHPERMAEVWQEVGELVERGIMREDPNRKPKDPPEIMGVPLRENVWLPMRDSRNQPIAFFLAMDPMRGAFYGVVQK